MKRLGYHRIRWADESTTEGPLVAELDDANRLVGWHLLKGEEAATQWIGGELKIEQTNK